MYMPMFIVLSLSFNLGINPIELSGDKIISQSAPVSSECVLSNTELNSGIIVTRRINDVKIKNVITTIETEYEEELSQEIKIAKHVPAQSIKAEEYEIVSCVTVDVIEDEIVSINNGLIIQEQITDAEIPTDSSLVETEQPIEETDNTGQNNSYHDVVDVIVPSIHEEDELEEHNNSYHDIDFVIPSIHK